MALLPAALAGLMLILDRLRPGKERARLGGLLLLAYLATWLHVFLDFLNTYGVRLLMPFSERWFYGDALYIVEPIMYVVLGGGILIGRLRAPRGQEAKRPPRLALALAAGYVTLMLASNAWARAEVREGLIRAGRPAETRFMVSPVFGNPFRREVVIDVGPRYEKGFLWFEPAPHFRPAGYGVNVNADHPLAQQAAATERGRAYLRWSRFPFFVVQTAPGGRPQVHVNDYRYAGPEGRDTWLATTIDLPQ
jgi:inner membrane protein